MATLVNALQKLDGHPDDAYPNSLEPLSRWAYLKDEPYRLNQLELNALQNFRFPGINEVILQWSAYFNKYLKIFPTAVWIRFYFYGL